MSDKTVVGRVFHILLIYVDSDTSVYSFSNSPSQNPNLHFVTANTKAQTVENSIFVASKARDLLSDAIHFQCHGTHTQ